MELIIQSSMSLGVVRGFFNTIYPHLKIEFFDFMPGSEIKFSRKNLVKDMDITLYQLGHMKQQEYIRISPTNKTVDLERLFHEKFGVYAQVFRKAGTIWLETTKTDNWTLVEQEKAGIESSSDKREDTGSFPDYDLYHEQL